MYTPDYYKQNYIFCIYNRKSYVTVKDLYNSKIVPSVLRDQFDLQSNVPSLHDPRRFFYEGGGGLLYCYTALFLFLYKFYISYLSNRIIDRFSVNIKWKNCKIKTGINFQIFIFIFIENFLFFKAIHDFQYG